jgi:hypothetical protein
MSVVMGRMRTIAEALSGTVGGLLQDTGGRPSVVFLYARTLEHARMTGIISPAR